MLEPTIIFADADDFANNTEPALVLLQIRKESIESGNIASTLERLHILTDSGEKARLYREALVIAIDGYDNDPRELCEVPEVRAFFARLTEEWPFWLWFLDRQSGSVKLLLTFLCEVTVTRGTNGFYTRFASKDEVKKKMLDMFNRGDALFQIYGLSEEEAAESTESAMQELVA